MSLQAKSAVHNIKLTCTAVHPLVVLDATTVIPAVGKRQQSSSVKDIHTFYNDEVRRLTKQPHLSAIVQSKRLSLFGHIARMPDETDAKQILTASPAGNWTRPLGRPHITWMKTIQQDLKSSNLSMDDAVDLVQNRPLCRSMSMFGATHS